MRQINEVLRLRHQCQLSVRDIARSCGLPASTVGDYLKRAEAVNLGWPLPEGLSQKQLQDQLLGCPQPVSDGLKTEETGRFENRVRVGGRKTPSEGYYDGGAGLGWMGAQGGLIWSLVR